MSIDDRDWYVDKLRKATGHVERARFRISIGETRRTAERRRGWSSLLGIFALIVVAALVLLLLLKLLLTR